ncbi:sterol desaturase family protein [Pseudanabaena sp. 'Roaring Creek']|uniref:sterol desaturase family protein n=1 Tax=Pseudanabaena sp. 'Roaring Creek' TaxID=1681830 RepID=UPI00092E4051|nr:sterol desaturase family protein [Pseudanabaena sp. 'Roaring Creek']
MQKLLILDFFPIVAFAIALELAYLSWHHKLQRYYAWRESLATVGVFMGYIFSGMLSKILLVGLSMWTWEHRLMTIPLDTWWGVLLLFFAIEFFYYWQHRASHRIRWIWASHAVHHSVNHLNLSSAYRLGWTGWLSGNFLFFLPPVWLGFHPIAVGIGLSFNLFYQFWIHSEYLPKLGVLEWMLNTPSHHRVHHASNHGYIDRNYGGVLILWDRLFGTFAEEKLTNPPIYGLTKPVLSYNPIVIALHEWFEIFRDMRMVTSWHERLAIAIGSPSGKVYSNPKWFVEVPPKREALPQTPKSPNDVGLL